MIIVIVIITVAFIEIVIVETTIVAIFKRKNACLQTTLEELICLKITINTLKTTLMRLLYCLL